MADRTFLLKIIGDTAGIEQSLGDVESKATGLSGTVGGIGKAVGGAMAVGAIASFGSAVVSSASDAEQALGAARSTFGEYSGEIEKFSETTAAAMGISGQDFLQISALTGSLLKNTGAPMEEVSQITQDLTGRAADLAATFGGSVEDAMGAINSALKGETDPLEAFGISIKASTVEAKAQAMGLVDAEGNATAYGKAMAANALIMEQSADKAGTFAEESGTLAGSQAIMSAKMEDLTAHLGQKLMPIIVKVMGLVMPFFTWIADNIDWIAPIVAGITGIVLGVKAWSIAQGILNTVLALNPIGLIVAAIVALVAGVILAYQKVDWFREFVDAAFKAIIGFGENLIGWITTAWDSLVAILTWPFTHFQEIVDGVVNAVVGFATGIGEKLRTALSTVLDILKWPFEQAANGISAIFDPVLNFFTGIKDTISGAFGGLADVIKLPFVTAFDVIKTLWNATVGGFGFSVPGWVPGIGGKEFRIPEMAAGGIITSPTIALLGEAGPEAVIPLGRLAAGGAASGVTINVYALTGTADVGRRVADALAEYERTTGRRAV